MNGFHGAEADPHTYLSEPERWAGPLPTLKSQTVSRMTPSQPTLSHHIKGRNPGLHLPLDNLQPPPSLFGSLTSEPPDLSLSETDFGLKEDFTPLVNPPLENYFGLSLVASEADFNGFFPDTELESNVGLFDFQPKSAYDYEPPVEDFFKEFTAFKPETQYSVPVRPAPGRFYSTSMIQTPNMSFTPPMTAPNPAVRSQSRSGSYSQSRAESLNQSRAESLSQGRNESFSPMSQRSQPDVKPVLPVSMGDVIKKNMYFQRPGLERSALWQPDMEKKKKKKPPKGVVCPICDKYISRDYSRHQRIHDEVSRFSCVFPRSVCLHKKNKFNRPYDYKKHLLNVHFKFDDPHARAAPNLTEKLEVWGHCAGCGARFRGHEWLESHVLGGDRCPAIDPETKDD